MTPYNRDVDTILKEALQSNELPPPVLIHQVKAAAEDAKRNKQKRGGSRLLKQLAVAALCLIVGLSATALATNFFGLWDLALPDPELSFFVEHPDGTVEEQPVQLISLQGFAGSPEHAAGVAWQTFLNAYDLEATLAATGNSWGDVPEQYWMYGAYSLEMVEKIHEIAERYELSLLGAMLDIRTQEEFQKSIASGPLFADDSVGFMGYLFESGTFRLDGYFEKIGFQLGSSRKGVFDNVFLNVGDIANFEEWNYENVHGTTLLLMQRDYQSLIFLETETAFITVNILAGTEGNRLYTGAAPFTRDEMEQFADLIHFEHLREGPPDPELMAMFEEQRRGAEEAIVFLVGEWKHVRSEDSDGNLLPMPEEEDWLKIKENRSIFFLRGEGAWAAYTVNSTYLRPGGWVIRGELSLISRYSFQVNIWSMITACPEDSLLWQDTWETQLQYDPVNGLLRHTDGAGNHHFYARVPCV